MGKEPPRISVVFPVRNEGKNVKMTLDSLFSVKTNIPFEAIIVDDASTDNGCHFIKTYVHNKNITYIRTNGIGPANARNLGASRAKYEYLVFCDAHMTFENFWLDRLIFPILSNLSDAVCPAIASLDDPKVVGYGQSLNSNLRIKWNPKKRYLFETAILPGACIVLSKKVFDEIGGFETGFATWGHEDVEISLKLWLFGYRCHCEPSVKILHLFRTHHPYNVQYEGTYYNLMRMAYLHFDSDRIQKTKSLIIHNSPAVIENRVLNDGVLSKKKLYEKRRKMQIDELFRKFRISF
ncbi:glycosyltransferase involved in cell wall biosynthesis [Bacillus pakistanensis]|uniref:Glycosyltransferase involved in cell wall biosynthesis n=1 Tax=Rossellomorea pakistanensis TaxID=992288 RepID=A0ABS2NGE3_9BACI|nr:glycosyltransferase [Bacillus pakistanensis]MBM7586936.1 glycosyltransferase involved in cell wall biosynthesis [Bacillus pakistanensis]